MPLTELNHYFVRASNLEATKDFYCKALDLDIMPRPPFPFAGYWLGREGRIWVHMGQHGIPNAELYYRGTPKHAAQDNSGVVDHIAFLATDPEAFRDRFGEMKCDFWARALPDFDLFQIFVRDPDVKRGAVAVEPRPGGGRFQQVRLTLPVRNPLATARASLVIVRRVGR